MSWISRLLGSLRKNKLEDQLNDELQFHIELRTQEFVAAGMRPQEARRKACVLFGNQMLLKERTRYVDTLGWVDAFLQDLRFAFRMLRCNPGFTLVTIATLALGIGANTAIFSLLNAMVLRPLSLRDPDQLVMITETKRNLQGERAPTHDAYFAWKKYSRTFQEFAFGDSRGDPVTLSDIGHAERISEAGSSMDYLSMLGVKPLRGRLFLPEDASDTTVVISEDLWERVFAAEPKVLGQTVSLEGSPKTIIGVLPRGFSVLPWNVNVDAWTAYKVDPSPIRWMPLVGRLKPNVPIEQAQAELNSIAHGMEQLTDVDSDWSIHIERLHETFIRGARTYFYILLGAVGFILLIACTNVANLLLARGTVRQNEIAIRVSLGAGRGRLIRQLLTESLLLGVAGGAFGVLIGYWGTRLLVSLAPSDPIRTLPAGVDLTVLVFTFGLSLLTVFIFGLVPAFRVSRPDLNQGLKEGGGRYDRVSAQWSQGVLLVSEVALGAVLLVGAGLLINSYIRMQKVDLGFEPENVVRADVLLDGPKFWHNAPGTPGVMKTVTLRSDIFFRETLDRIVGIPEVVSAGISHLAPPGGVLRRSFRVIGRPAQPLGRDLIADYDEVSAGFFDSLKIPLVKGRYLTERDTEGSPWVVDINETMARRYFHNEDPVGKFVQTAILANNVGGLEEDHPRMIVGVVGNVRHYGVRSRLIPTMYGSYRQHGMNYPGGLYLDHCWKSFTVRTAGNPMNIVTALQKVVAEVDKDQALFDVQTETEALAASMAFPRFQMQMFGIFGGIGLLLAAVGIYGVTSYLVAQRTHEFGVRIALGARPFDVLRLVILRGSTTIAIGLLAGIIASLALTRLIAAFLFGVKNTDPMTYSLVAMILMAVALIACIIPALRATKVDPLVALRHQ